MSNFTVLQDTQFDTLIDAIRNGGGGGGGGYTLPPATSTSLGGVKVGSGLSITSDGTLSATGGGGGGSSEDYSQTEHVIGSWVDGRPLYQKTVVYTQNISGTTNIPHNIENFDYCTDFKGIIFDRDAESKPLNGVIHDFGTTLNEFAINRTNVYMVVKGSSTWGGIMITINYVKS